MAKQESHFRTRSAVAPSRLLQSSTVVQKQVGQTMVQLAQVKQRAATSSQRGWFEIGLKQLLEPLGLQAAAHLFRGVRNYRFGGGEVRLPWRARCGSSASRAAPASLPASTRNS